MELGTLPRTCSPDLATAWDGIDANALSIGSEYSPNSFGDLEGNHMLPAGFEHEKGGEKRISTKVAVATEQAILYLRMLDEASAVFCCAFANAMMGRPVI